jgi:hypothetical protein
VAGEVGGAGVAVAGDALAVVGVVALLDDDVLPQEDEEATESVATAIRATSTEPHHGRRFMTTVLGST